MTIIHAAYFSQQTWLSVVLPTPHGKVSMPSACSGCTQATGINSLHHAATTASMCQSCAVLTGEPIATRWSASLKREIKASRVTTTTNLVVSKLDQWPPVKIIVVIAGSCFDSALTPRAQCLSVRSSHVLGSCCLGFMQYNRLAAYLLHCMPAVSWSVCQCQQ